MQWLSRVFASAVVRKLSYAVAVLLIAAFSQCAHAAGTIAVTPGQQIYYTSAHAPLTLNSACSSIVVGGNVSGTDRAAVAATACYNGVASGTTYTGKYCAFGTVCGNVTANVTAADGIVGVLACTSPACTNYSNSYTYGFQPGSVTSATCSAHSFANAAPPTACTCDDGYAPNSGATACVVPPGVCADKLTQPMGSPGQEFTYPTSSAAAPSRVCFAGCGYIPRAAVSTLPGVVSKLGAQYWYIARSAADWIGDGATCTPADVGAPGDPGHSTPQPLPDAPPKGMCPGTVNGVSVNVPCDTSTSNSGTSGAGASSGAASGAAGTSSTGTTSATTCSGSNCTTTTTTTTTTSSGTTTSTATESQDKGDFCAEHPGSPQCSPEDDPSDPCDDAPERAGCKNLGTLEATPLQNVDVPLAITPSTGYGPSNATCPAPQTATLMGHTYSFSWQPFCDLATGIRPVVIALAWLTAAIGFLGLSRKGN